MQPKRFWTVLVLTTIALLGQQPKTTATVISKGVTTEITQPSLAELAETRLTRTLSVERGGAIVKYELDDIAHISVTKPEAAGTECRLTINLSGGKVVEGVKTAASEAHRTWIVGKTRDGGAFSVLLCNAKENTLTGSKP